MESDSDRSSANGLWPTSKVGEAESLEEKSRHFKTIRPVTETLPRAQKATQATAICI